MKFIYDNIFTMNNVKKKKEIPAASFEDLQSHMPH